MSEGNGKGAVEPVELYRRHRPRIFKHVFGQDEAVKQLSQLIDTDKFPHVLLFSGPSGTGKTTLARILKKKLDCGDSDYQEVNAAESRGIDTIREIQSRMGLSPFGGKCRIWLFDECHKLTSDAQTALLKTLEDTPRHVYFFLCTTEPEKLLKTIRGRCTRINLNSLDPDNLKAILTHVAKKEGAALSDKVRDRIVEVADGSAREALVQLHKALSQETEQEQLEAVQRSGTVRAAFDIVKALLWEPCRWADVAAIITGIADGENWEGIRQLIISVAAKEVLKANKNSDWAQKVLLEFEDKTWFYSGRAGLVKCCYAVFKEKGK